MTDVKHSHITRDIKPPEECHACALGLLRALRVERQEDMKVALQTVTVLGEEVTKLRTKVTAAEGVMLGYSGWWDGAPEDSWRLERDMREALGMPPYDEDNEDYEEVDPAVWEHPMLHLPPVDPDASPKFLPFRAPGAEPIQTPYDF